MNSEQYQLFTTLFVLNLAKQWASNSHTKDGDDNKENTHTQDKVNNNDQNLLFSGAQPEPPTPPRTPTTSGSAVGSAASSSSSNGDHNQRTPTIVPDRPPAITLTPTSKLMAEFRRFSQDQQNNVNHADLMERFSGAATSGDRVGGNASDTEEPMDYYSDRGSNPSFDLSRFNDDSNQSEASDQESDMGMTIDSQNSLDGRLSFPPTRKLMDNKNSPTPLVSNFLTWRTYILVCLKFKFHITHNLEQDPQKSAM